MKKYIREMIDDLRNVKRKGFVPTPPAAMPEDLSNQVLSQDAAEKVKQLDYQAFESERLQTGE